jgi:pilus assembly protein CpaF
MVILTLTEKGGEPRQLSFEKNEITIGRVQGNDVVLPKGNVSKRHCRIYIQDGHFSVEDLKSTNGTYVNGRKISEPTALTTADKVYVGDFVARVDNATPAEVPTPPPPGNEAGSLSSALSRRPPPPPPRATGTMRTLVEEPEPPQRNRSSSSMRLPPPPPPRRDSRPIPTLNDEEPPTPNVTVPADIDLDDESLSSQPPRLNLPPLKPVVPVSARQHDGAESARHEQLQNDEHDHEPPTANRGRGLLPRPAPGSGAPVLTAPSDYPAWLRKLLDGEGVTAVYISAPDSVEIERNGRREPAALSPSDAETLADNLRALAGRGTPRPSPEASVVNVTLPDGSRLVAVFPPAAAQVCAALHRASGVQKSLGDLASEGALSKEMQQVLEACSSTRRNVIVSGDRRAAELLLQALANTIASRFRVVVVADRVAAPGGGTAWIKLTTEPRNPDVMTAAIALRPDYLIVDVTAATTAADLLQECAVGQEGVFAAVAARSASDALARLQALAGSALGGSSSVRELLAGSFDLIVHASTMNDGSVRILEIAEPRADHDGRLVAEPLLTWRADEGRNGGRFQTTNAPSRLAATLAARGVQVPASVLQR